MKQIIPFALLCALATSTAPGAVTDPVGYVSLGNTTPGQPAVPANTDVVISIPFFNATEATVSVASVAGSTISLADSPGLTVDQFVSYYAVAKTGANSGQVLLVTANAADSLTVSALPGDSADGLAAGDSLELSPAWTIGSFLGGSLPDGAQLIAYSGTGQGINLAGDQIYFSSAGAWLDSTTFAPADDVVLFPGESFVLRNSTATPVDELVVSGSVPTVPSRLIIFGGNGPQDTRFGYIGPVNESLANASLGFANGDQLLVFDNSATGIEKAASAIYFYDSGQWYDSTTFLPADISLTGGQGYVFRTGGPSSDIEWSDEQDYQPLQ